MAGGKAENAAAVERLAKSRPVLPCGFEVAREYGLLKQALRAKGRPIPENDMWIAATAIHHQMTHATQDRHFHDVPELSFEDWS